MEFSFDNPSGSTLGSDRLRKAIERNRAKQAKREARIQSSIQSSSQMSAGPATRRSVARADNFEFSETVKKKKTPPAVVGYMGTKKRASRKSTKSTSKKWGVKIAIACACLLVMRLVFADRGVLDYYLRTRKIADKEFELKMIKDENRKLKKEIGLIQKSSSYQKKLVRDHLGFISSDEYLVIFSDKKESSSI